MSLGFADAGFRVVGAIDSDPLNVRTHKRNLPDTRCWKGDLTKLSGSQIRRRCGLKAGDLDVVFGGPPCQGFSEIGRQKKNDARNRLFHRFAVLVAELRPRYFVLENVRGLLFDRHGAAFQRFVRSVQDAGYDVVTPTRVLDAADFGVPQRRRRAFILGHKRGLTPPSYPTKAATPPPTVLDAIGDLPDVDEIEDLKEGDTYLGKLGVPSAYAADLRRPRSGAAADPSLTLTGCQRTKHKAAVRRRFDRTVAGSFEKRSRCYRLSSAGLAHTLRAGTGPEAGSFTAARPIHPERPRYVTVREAARLHSFPDWFVFERAKWHALRQIGNSVPPLLARAVAEEIINVLIAKKKVEVADRKAS